MTLAVQNAAPSYLDAVLGQLTDAFGDMADATPVMVGKQYLERGEGTYPRVVLVPEQGGSWGPPRESGYAASIAHGCDVYVRGVESGDDVGRFNAARQLADLVMDCIVTACGWGNLEGGAFQDNSPTDADGPGAELKFSFRYKRDVPHTVARWSLDPATSDGSAKRVGVPPGQPGTITSVTPTTVPVED